MKKLILVICLLSASPAFATSDCSRIRTNCDQTIQRLQARIQALKAQLNPPVVTPEVFEEFAAEGEPLLGLPFTGDVGLIEPAQELGIDGVRLHLTPGVQHYWRIPLGASSSGSISFLFRGANLGYSEMTNILSTSRNNFLQSPTISHANNVLFLMGFLDNAAPIYIDNDSVYLLTLSWQGKSFTLTVQDSTGTTKTTTLPNELDGPVDGFGIGGPWMDNVRANSGLSVWFGPWK